MGRNLGYGGTNARMMRNQLRSLNDEAMQLLALTRDDDSLPDWMVAKVITALDGITTARQYLKSKLQGMKKNPLDTKAVASQALLQAKSAAAGIAKYTRKAATVAGRGASLATAKARIVDLNRCGSVLGLSQKEIDETKAMKKAYEILGEAQEKWKRKNPKIVKTKMVEPRELEFWGFNKSKIREIRRWIPIVLKEAQRRAKSKRKFPSPIVAMSKEEIEEGRRVVDKAHPKGAGHGLYYIDYQLVKVNPQMTATDILANVLHENLHHLRPDWSEVKVKALTGEIMYECLGKKVFGQPKVEIRTNNSKSKSKKLVIVSLFDRSGRMIKPWIGKGHTIYTIDLGPKNYPNWKGVKHIQMDARKVQPFDSDVLFCFPPCTDFSTAGNRWIERKLAQDPLYIEKAFELVDVARNWATMTKYWLIENPVGKLSTLWRSPDWYFQPYQYAGYAKGAEQLFNFYTKRTAIWSNYSKPPMRYIQPQFRPTQQPPSIEGEGVACEIRPRNFTEQESFARKILSKGVARLKGREKRKYLRSLTPSGFAQAIYQHLQSNTPYQQQLVPLESAFEKRSIVPNPKRNLSFTLF